MYLYMLCIQFASEEKGGEKRSFYTSGTKKGLLKYLKYRPGSSDQGEASPSPTEDERSGRKPHLGSPALLAGLGLSCLQEELQCKQAARAQNFLMRHLPVLCSHTCPGGG